jgi:esterase
MKLFFQKLGQGPPLIILHGLYGSSDNWITYARWLSEHFTIYLVDQRNHGRSPHSRGNSYELMAEDLRELITDENLDNVILLGHSMGGKTAMLFTALYPEKVKSLVVVDIGPGSYISVDNYSPQALVHLNIANTMLSADLTKYNSRVDIERELTKTIKETTVRQFIMKNVSRSADNSFSWKLNVEEIAQALPAIMGAIPLDKVPEGKKNDHLPVLFIKGEQSNYINSEQLLLIKKYFPSAQLEIIPGAGHWVHAEQPELFMHALNSFLILKTPQH